MTIETLAGEKIDVTEWVDRMTENVRHKRHIFEGTPIGLTADKNYFWWDLETDPPLNKKSVQALARAIKAIKAK